MLPGDPKLYNIEKRRGVRVRKNNFLIKKKKTFDSFTHLLVKFLVKARSFILRVCLRISIVVEMVWILFGI